MNLHDPQSIIVQIVEIGIGQRRIETAQLHEIQRIVLTIVNLRQHLYVDAPRASSDERRYLQGAR